MYIKMNDTYSMVEKGIAIILGYHKINKHLTGTYWLSWNWIKRFIKNTKMLTNY